LFDKHYTSLIYLICHATENFTTGSIVSSAIAAFLIVCRRQNEAGTFHIVSLPCLCLTPGLTL
jgi:hypothetical protein